MAPIHQGRKSNPSLLLVPPAPAGSASPLLSVPVAIEPLLADDFAITTSLPTIPLLTCPINSQRTAPAALTAVQGSNHGLDVLRPLQIHETVVVIARLRRLRLVRRDKFRHRGGCDALGSEMRGEQSLNLFIDGGLWLDPREIADVEAPPFRERRLPV